MSEYLIDGAAQAEETWIDEGCYIRELLNDPRNPDHSLAECRVEPGVTTQWHRLSVAEWYIIRDGSGLMQLGDDPPFRVRAGDSVAIPAALPQRITNDGAQSLCFLCLCQPRFTPDCYAAL